MPHMLMIDILDEGEYLFKCPTCHRRDVRIKPNDDYCLCDYYSKNPQWNRILRSLSL